MLRHMATESCEIRRTTLANGERDPSAATVIATGLGCTPLSSADVRSLGALQQNGLIQSVSQVFETVLVSLADVQVNDIAVIDDVTYLVVAVAVWPTMSAQHLTLERVLQ